MQLTDFECPNCGASDMVTTGVQTLRCAYCGSEFGEVARLCPGCGHYNGHGARHCAECGAPLVRDCPVCGASNWVQADHCVRCGRNLDVIDQITQRWQQGTRQRLEARRGGMAALKEAEERASQERMAELLEAERIRQRALAVADEARRRRDRQIYRLIVAAVAVFVIIVLLTLLLTARG